MSDGRARFASLEPVHPLHLAGKGIPDFGHAINAADRFQIYRFVRRILHEVHVQLADLSMRDKHAARRCFEIATHVIRDECGKSIQLVGHERHKTAAGR